MNGHISIRDFRNKFIIKAITGDKKSVELLFMFFQSIPF